MFRALAQGHLKKVAKNALCPGGLNCPLSSSLGLYKILYDVEEFVHNSLL